MKEIIASVEGITPELTEKLVAILSPVLTKEKTASFDAGVGRSYEEVEKYTKETFGIDKNENEKATDYFKRSAGLFKSGVKNSIEREYEPIKNELTTLQEKIKSGISDEKLKKEFDELKETYNITTKQMNELKESFESEKKDITLNFQIKNAIAGLKFNIEDKEYIDHKIGKFIADAKTEYEIVETDKGLLFKGNSKNGYKDFTIDELVNEKLGSLIKKDGEQAKQIVQGAANARPDIQISQAKTKGEAYEIIRQKLITQGLKISSPDWEEKFKSELKANEAIINNIK